MCAMEAGKRGRKVLLIDHADKVGKKILISGGGRCNFTNIGAKASCYVSQNPHFCKSAFGQYTQHDFINMVERHGIAYHEKKLGQLFCDKSAKQIVQMFLDECESAGVDLRLNTSVSKITKTDDTYTLTTTQGVFSTQSLVIATGGPSIPKMGATGFGYQVAKQFGVPLTATVPALVPFTFSQDDLKFYEGLSGISFDAIVRCGKVSFRENVLITHRGVSGPAILQISSYWQPGDEVRIQILPDINWADTLKKARDDTPKKELKTLLADLLPKRFIQRLLEAGIISNKIIAEVGNKEINRLHEFLTNFTIKPNGTEGYKKAEVTLGGVQTDALVASTLECKEVKGLYFIGEVVDVTGWLGGYNFQWAWSSGYAAGQVV